MEQVRLLSMTVVLTALIWVSADSLVTEAVLVNVTFDVVAATPDSDMLLEVATPGKPFELQVSGPRKTVESVREQAPLRIRLPVSDRSTTGPVRIWLERDVLKRALADQGSEFKRLTVVSVQPDTLPIMVDHWVSRDVDIVLSRLSLAYDVEPQLSRASTTVKMRQSHFAQLPSGQALQIDVSGDLERLLKEQPAGQSVTVPLTLDSRAFGQGAELTPSSIEVTATVMAQRKTVQIPTVPILVAVSFANLEKNYRAVTSEGDPLTLVTQTITITGPTDEVNRLERGATRAFGIIQLKEADLEQLGVQKLMTPEYHLPPGIQLAEDPAPIQFQLIYANEIDGGR